tara:strand:+ start:1720 stop:2313 length:594 start_codon:yes stop_codon:yes gene_type:complete
MKDTNNIQKLLNEIYININNLINKETKINLLNDTVKFNNTTTKIIELKKSGTSKVYKDINNTIVIKKIVKYQDYNVFEREVHILKLLNSKNINIPKLLYYDIKNQIIIMSYCGIPINKQVFQSNNNYKNQLSNIIKELKKLNIKHNDIKHNSEILLLNNTVYLCDFGWATINNNLHCNINLCNKPKPSGIIDDDIFL